MSHFRHGLAVALSTAAAFYSVKLNGIKSDIQKLVAAAPFIPFTIHLADGGQLRVPGVDHIAVPPAGGRIFVLKDDGGYEVLSGLLISRIAVDRETVAA